MLYKFNRNLLLSAFLIGLFWSTPPTPVLADGFTVNSLLDENDGECILDCTLREAIDVAVDNDLITFSVSGTIALTSGLDISEDLTFMGPGTSALTIGGSGSERVFYINSSTVSMDGMTISGGFAEVLDGDGGGIHAIGSTVDLNNMIITNNSTSAQYSKGGGIYASGGSLTITNSQITSNHSYFGSGIYCTLCSLNMTNVIVSGNDGIDLDSFTAGGGLFIDNSPDAQLLSVNLTDNAAGYAGALFIRNGSSATINKSAIANNIVDSNSGGGGVYISDASNATINNTTISSNQATNASASGGGLAVHTGSTVSLNNSTIANNTSGFGGGGVYIGAATMNFRNTILADNSSINDSAEDCYLSGVGSINSLDYNLIEDSNDCTFFGSTTHNITGQDPLLKPLAVVNGTQVQTLQVSPSVSPALDAGDDASCEADDQAGGSRPAGPHCDIGAKEYVGGTVVNTNDNGGGSLRFEAVHIPSGETVTFDPSLSGQTITLASSIVFSEDINIDGSSLATPITISGNDTNTIFKINTGINVSLDSLNLVNGLAPGGLGGSDLGGAIFNYGHLTIKHLTFANNVAKGYGGAIYSASGTSLSIDYSLFTSNGAADTDNGTQNGGGAITIDNSPLSIRHTYFIGNSSDGNGGAIHLLPGTAAADISSSTFESNTSNGAFGGGAIYNGVFLTVKNSTFANNSANGATGGGIANDETVYIYNSTFSGNTAPNGGGAVSSDSVLELYNSILANSLNGVEDCINDGGSAVDKNINSLIEAQSTCGSTLLSADPQLGPLTNNGGSTPTFMLLPTSPAVDAGDNFSAEPTDQRDEPRTYGVADIGSYELKKSATSVTSVNINDGWILESTETSSVGGAMNSTTPTFILGDDATNKQFRAILHFDTSTLPDNAVVTSAILQIRRHSTVGTNPFTILGNLRVDLRKLSFGIPTLELADFRSAAHKNNVAVFNTTPINNWYSGTLTPMGRLNINRTGTTQFRIYFTIDDNNDLGADFMRFNSGNMGVTLRPKLVIQYYVP